MCQLQIAKTLDLLTTETNRLRQMKSISQGQFIDFTNLTQQAIDGLQADHTRIHNELCDLRRGLISILERLNRA